MAISVPSLIVQGERDAFGSRGEIERLRLSHAIEMHWIADGDHDFKPRRARGLSHSANLTDAADAVADFMRRLGDRR